MEQIDGLERELRERELFAVKVDQITALDTVGGADVQAVAVAEAVDTRLRTARDNATAVLRAAAVTKAEGAALIPALESME